MNRIISVWQLLLVVGEMRVQEQFAPVEPTCHPPHPSHTPRTTHPPHVPATHPKYHPPTPRTTPPPPPRFRIFDICEPKYLSSTIKIDKVTIRPPCKIAQYT